MSERYLVEYDIPVERRFAFYKALSRFKEKERRFFTSTQSVIIIDDKELAWKIYHLAKRYGKTNIWVATKLNGEE